MEVTVEAAGQSLPELIDAARTGEEVTLTREGRPVARLVPIARAGFKIGILEGKLPGPGPDFFEPMSEEDLRLWEGGPAAER